MNHLSNHISICICTYRRPILLCRLLDILICQKTENLFSYSITVVDNDFSKSAEAIVSGYSIKATIPVRYCLEPEKNIAHARNRAVQNADGNFIAFIDDDECPEITWLLNMYKAFFAYKCDGVLGPVNPKFEAPPPLWLLKSKLLDRPRFVTGTFLTINNLRSGNVLLVSELFSDKKQPFDSRFGKTGGEDGDFFRKLLAQGKHFIWCDEAPAWESVPAERFKRSYFLKRGLLRGISEVRTRRPPYSEILKSATAVLIYAVGLPFFIIIGQHVFMKFLMKSCDHLGKIFAFFGIDLLKQRDF
jgi:succinoglycan biosynthesis protein ExoM